MPIDPDRLGWIATREATYESWRRDQGIPVLRGFHVPDLRDIEVADWDWKGGKGCFLDLEGTAETNDGYVLELAPGDSTRPVKHIYEEVVYILAGQGKTRVWLDDARSVEFSWKEGSLFAIPLNATYEHINTRDDHPARYLAVTSAPLIINLFHNYTFVFENAFEFTDRFNGEADYFSGEGRSLERRIWDTNFVPDLHELPLESWEARGSGSKNRGLELAQSTMVAHVSQFPVGRYKKAHRHGPGAHVVILEGEGYSLMWPEGEPPKRFDWKPGSVVVPPDQWFHQHFNLGDRPAKYLALRWNSHKYRVFKKEEVDVDVAGGGSQIETKDEDPMIREMFQSELALRGVELAV